jgi:ketosteroid isomerase-like protein
MAVLTKKLASQFAQDWIQAWNSHDLDDIMSHYDDEVALTSPVAAQLLGDPNFRTGRRVSH